MSEKDRNGPGRSLYSSSGLSTSGTQKSYALQQYTPTEQTPQRNFNRGGDRRRFGESRGAARIRPAEEGPEEDAMAGVTRTCAIGRLVALRADEALRVETTTATEAQEVSRTVEALTMAIRAVTT